MYKKSIHRQFENKKSSNNEIIHKIIFTIYAVRRLFWRNTLFLNLIADFYALNITGPSIITEGDNVTFKCTSKYFQIAEEAFKWTHVTFENKMTVLSDNESE